MPSGSLLAAAIAADNLITALYAGIMMALPERWPGQLAAAVEGVEGEVEGEGEGGEYSSPTLLRWQVGSWTIRYTEYSSQ